MRFLLLFRAWCTASDRDLLSRGRASIVCRGRIPGLPVAWLAPSRYLLASGALHVVAVDDSDDHRVYGNHFAAEQDARRTPSRDDHFFAYPRSDPVRGDDGLPRCVFREIDRLNDHQLQV